MWTERPGPAGRPSARAAHRGRPSRCQRRSRPLSRCLLIAAALSAPSASQGLVSREPGRPLATRISQRDCCRWHRAARCRRRHRNRTLPDAKSNAMNCSRCPAAVHPCRADGVPTLTTRQPIAALKILFAGRASPELAAAPAHREPWMAPALPGPEHTRPGLTAPASGAPARFPLSGRSALGLAEDHPAWHQGLLIEVIARAHPVVAVSDP